MIVRNWMMQGGISSLYLTIDNTGNYYPLVNDQIEFTLLSSEIDFTKILSDVSNLIIMDGATVLKHYIDYNDYANGGASFFENRIHSNLTVFEYGCGNSTLWWARRV